MRRALPLIACALLAGCGGDDRRPAPADVAREVRATFTAYTEAMGREDFPAACKHLAGPSVQQLADDLQASGTPCPQLLDRLYGEPGSPVRRSLQDIVRSFRIKEVTTTEQPGAVVVAWSAEVDGERSTVEQSAVKVGERWLLVANPAPHVD